ncbi:winged helix-turn-helix domain-containing protein [Salinispirillum marinum]|uniref:Winged helix-turn-helix domain-containing protein n=2 Tax=Saccharospirillaceae TaxID=255527 RepID=A0ABV8A2A7_9GAMM
MTMAVKAGSVRSKGKTVLIVDHDAINRRRLADYFAAHQFDVLEEEDGRAALNIIAECVPDAVIADVDVPGDNGLTLCKLSRTHYDGAFILLSSRADELDQVMGLDMGADDFISKKASVRLLGARLMAVLRRSSPDVKRTTHLHERLDLGDLVIDNTMREAWLKGETIDLTSAEFDLLWLLCSHAGKILTREEIFTALRGIEYDGQDRSVDVRVSRIRPKVGDDPDHPRRIKTVRSKGYLLVEDAFTDDYE